MSKYCSMILLLLCAGMILFPGAAHAQTSRLYLASYMGLNTYGDQDFTDSASSTSGDLKFKNAWSFAGALGLRLSQNTRMEAEINYANTDFDRVNFTGVGSFEMGGDITSWIGMMNVYYDVPVDWVLQPYIGGGLGFGFFDAQIDDISGFATDTSDDAVGLAWQVGGGFKYRMSPEMALTTGYRYLGTSNLEFGGYDIDYGAHEFRVGLEWDLPVGNGK